VSLVKKRAIVDGFISVGSLCALIAMLAAFNPEVREQISMRVSAGQPAAQLSNAEATVRSVASIVLISAREQSIEHAPLLIFVLMAIVLILFMLRT
jgi:hypothetical protein